jgi:hypothetical protein
MKPSLSAILWNDWPALASWIGAAVAWLLYCGHLVLGRASDDSLYRWLAMSASVVLFAVLAWRVRRVYALFARGIEVPGRITEIAIFRDRGRLEFNYRIEGQASVSWAPIHKTSRVLGFSEGQAIRVLVHAADPSRAIVKELYI